MPLCAKYIRAEPEGGPACYLNIQRDLTITQALCVGSLYTMESMKNPRSVGRYPCAAGHRKNQYLSTTNLLPS